MNRSFCLVLLLLILVTACKKEEKEEYVSTGEISDLYATGLSIDGSINQLPGDVVQHGHCYSTAKAPGISGPKSELGRKSESGSFTSMISGLVPQTTYYIRAYAVFNSDTTCYGEETNFITEAQTSPEVSSVAADATNLKSIRLNGVLDDLGNGITEIIAHGHVWDRNPDPGFDDSKSDLGSRKELGPFSTLLDSLTPATTYYFRAYASNTVGTTFGEELMFTSQGVPEVQTLDIYFTGVHTIHVNGEVLDDGGIPDFERGFCFGKRPGPTIEDGTITEGANRAGVYSTSIPGLDEHTRYYIRAFVKNDYITVYGHEIEAETDELPSMISIPRGSFNMGMDEPGADYAPQHRVSLSAFSLSTYEISNQEFASFLNETSVSMDGDGLIFLNESPFVFENNGKCFRPLSGSEDYPVVNVSWNGAQAFCEWAGGHLPTEAQWEYAAREGGKSSYEYSGGNNPWELAIFWNNADQTKFPDFEGRGPGQVGQMKANALGLYDMSGNVWEWCLDWYAAYDNTGQTNPEGPSEPTNSKVGRGGSWRSGTDALRVYYRSRNKDDKWDDWHTSSLGFRLAK